MNILSWNVRGLGNPRTFRALNDLLREKNPHIVFLMETKCTSVQLKENVVKWGNYNYFEVERIGNGEGVLQCCGGKKHK